MDRLFAAVQSMMGGGIVLTLVASFLWGVLSIVLSPCHLTSIPLIIGFVDSGEVKTRLRKFTLSTLFSLGILVSIALIGILTASAGRVVGDLGSWSYWLAAGIFALIGFHFLDIIPLDYNGLSSLPIKKKGRRAALLVGLLFGVALGPCTFAFMAPVLAVTFSKADSSVFENSLILSAYGIGHSLLIVLAGTFTGVLEKYLAWNREGNSSGKLKKIAGVGLLLGALYFLWK